MHRFLVKMVLHSRPYEPHFPPHWMAGYYDEQARTEEEQGLMDLVILTTMISGKKKTAGFLEQQGILRGSLESEAASERRGEGE